MNNQIQAYTMAEEWLMPDNPNKDEKSQMNLYLNWLADNQHNWLSPDLAIYRDWLLFEHDIATSSTTFHLGTIRSRYKAILRDNRFTDWLLHHVPGETMSEKHAAHTQVIQRLYNAMDPKNAIVKRNIKQDESDFERVHLTEEQVIRLLQQPQQHHGPDHPRTYRDRAILGVWVGMGLRRDEVRRLTTDDLQQQLAGELALRIRHGKGDKQRLIPYGANSWVLRYIQEWLSIARIKDGIIFRAVYRSGSIGDKPLTNRTMDRVPASYPIMIDDEETAIAGHDLRATYARIMFKKGMSVAAIQANMGHSNRETTLRYIGAVDASERVPKRGLLDPRLDS